MGQRKKVYLILPEALFKVAVQGKEPPVGFSGLGLAPEGKEEPPFLFLLLRFSQIPAGGKKRHEIRLYLLLRPLILPEGIQVFQKGVLPLFLFIIEEGTESQVLLFLVLAVSKKRTQNIGLSPFPFLVLTVKKEGPKIFPLRPRAQRGATGYPGPGQPESHSS